MNVRLSTTEAERRPNTPPFGAELAKELNGFFRERKSGKVQDEKRVATMCKIMKDMRNEAALNKEIKVNYIVYNIYNRMSGVIPIVNRRLSRRSIRFVKWWNMQLRKFLLIK